MKNNRVSACARISAWTCAALFAGSAIAQGAAPAIADCHRIESSVERLACYDAASGRAAKSAPPAATAATPAAPATPNVTTDAMSQAVAKEVAGNAATSMIDAAWSFDPSSPRYDIRFYRSNYALFGRYTDDANVAPYIPIFEVAGEPVHLDKTEAKFQISFKARLWTTDDRKWGAWVGYTQQNQWQVYNDDISRPFRETNYEPEIFVSYRPGIELPGGFHWRLVNAGFNHQSNGRTDTLSRSWNRLFAESAIENGNFALSARVWARINEDEPDDDNPDITDYLGHGQVSAIYRWRNNSFTGTVRGNLSTGKGAVQLGWFSPPILGPFRGYVQFFSGYGESLIDYNWKQTTIGAGIALSDGL